MANAVDRESRIFTGKVPGTLVAALCLAAGVMAQPTPIDADPAWYSGEPAWYHTSWSYRKKITIDRSKVPSTLTDFPVLVSFTTDTDLAADAQDDADDLLITAGDGTTKLAHEIEKFNGATGELVAWVKVPVLSSTESTVLYLYYGNAGAASQQAATSVWDSNFKGVWHLHNAASPAMDSTSNANNGTQSGGVTFGATGQINSAVSLDGLNDYLYAADANSLDTGDISTHELWIKRGDTTTDGALFGKFTNSLVCFSFSSGSGGAINCYKVGGGLIAGTTGIDLSGTSWHHFAVVKNGSSAFKIYIDGVDRTGTVTDKTLANTTYPFAFGADGVDVGPNSFYKGSLDEGRLSNTPRSADWIKAEYNNQSSPSAFYSVSAKETPASAWTPAPTTGGWYSVAAASWYNASWSHRKRISIDGAKVPSTQSNFPVLIKLSSDANLASRAQADGDDILLTSSNGTTKLSHEIEKYTSATGELVAWVNVPTLLAGTNTVLYLYYGNAGAANQQNATGVWDSNYKGVWHLPDGTTYSGADSIASGHTMSNAGGVTATTGQVAGAGTFGAANGYAQTGSFTLLSSPNYMTVSAWVKLSSLASRQTIFSTTNANTAGNWSLEVGTVNGDDMNVIVPGVFTFGADYASLGNSQWHQLAFSRNGTGNTGQFYVDGAPVTTNQNAADFSDSGEPKAIGVRTPASTQLFNGQIDEVRTSNTARSADWIKAEYNNQSSPSAFYTVDPEVAQTDQPQEWWAHRKKITISKDKVSGTNANFPALVSLATDADLKSKAQSNGNDLLFTSADGSTKLSHEIEKYTGATGELVAWVKVPSLASTADTVLYLYYGNAGAANQQNATGVWDANFKGVWHLNESPANDVAGHANSVGASNPGTPKNFAGSAGSTTNATGYIAGADHFDGNDDFVDTGTVTHNVGTGDFTWSAWVNPDVVTGWRAFASNGTWSPGLYAQLNGTGYGFYWSAGQASGSSVTAGQWAHVVGLRESGVLKYYINGVQTSNTPAKADSMANSTFQIGAGSPAAGDPYDGLVDEMRFSATRRSADWIQTEYNNQSAPGGFYSVGPDEAKGGWLYRKKITIDHTKVGSGPHTNFPVLINLATDTDLGADAQDDGDDLLFTSSDGTTKLAHEIETFSGTTGALVAWVNVPVLSSTDDTALYLYYGNATAQSQQNAAGVWDSSFKGVWHLSDSASSAVDTTSNPNDATQSNGVTFGSTGKVGKAVSLAASSNQVLNAGSDTSLDDPASLTLSAWIYPLQLSTDEDRALFMKSSGAANGSLYWDIGYGSGAGRFRFIKWCSSGVMEVTTTNLNAVSANNWQHVVVTWDGNTNGTGVHYYINGAEVSNTIANASCVSPGSDGSYSLRLGDRDDSVESFDGTMDEMRFSKTIRSAGWILTEYNNQGSPSTFYTLGSEEKPYVTNTYTIGTRTANVNITSVTGSGPWTAQLAAADLSNVAVNDKLSDEAATAKTWKITAVDDAADTVTVIDSEANGGAPSAAGSTQATISRWYTTIQAWETARQGDLVARNAIEKGELYKDSTFTAGVTIDGSTTDATHYLWLTVPASQRHNGTAGTGVKLDPAGTGHAVSVLDPYTKVDWLEITSFNGVGAAGVNVGSGGTNATLSQLVIHDWTDATSDVTGIALSAGASATIANTILYKGDHIGISVKGSGTSAAIYNSALFSMGNDGIEGGSGAAVTVVNTIAVSNTAGGAKDFDAGTGSFSAASDYNISSDTTAPGVNSLKSKAASNQFASVGAGTEDLHLKNGSEAIDNGKNLSASLWNDIDNAARYNRNAWDIGADETAATNTAGGVAVNTYTIGSRTANVNITSVGSGPPWTVQLAAGTDLSGVAVNDKLSDEAASAKSWKISAVDDANDTVTVTDSEANGGSPSAAGSTQATISRWYTTMQAWEDARDGDLVARNAIEKGELYNDSTFTDRVAINDSTTDATHYMWLTVAPSQRHTGRAGTGVKLDPTTAGSVIGVYDDYTVVEWMEITGYTGTSNGDSGIWAGSDTAANRAKGVKINNVIIHDFPDATYGLTGIYVYTTGSDATVTNSVVYNCDDSGIIANWGTAKVTVLNSTAYNAPSGSVAGWNGATAAAKNVIASSFQGTFTADSDYNVSFDTTAPGAHALKSRTAAETFISVTSGAENLQLRAGSQAIDNGMDLGGTVSGDMTGDARPAAAGWDIGADEAPASFAGGTVTNVYTIGSKTANVDITSVTGGPSEWTVKLAGPVDLSVFAVNDKLKDEASSAKSWKITALDNANDTVTVWDSEGNGGSPSAAGSTQATISRWYTSASTGLQDWETARQGDLVARDAIEKGELYKDATFTGTVTIDGSTTDATRYLWLTVAPGQRHTGLGGTGATINPSGDGHPVNIADPYTRIEWLELTGFTGAGNVAGINVGSGGTDATINNVLIHDYPDASNAVTGIYINSAGNATITNSILFTGDHRGIWSNSSARSKIYNTTIYNMGSGEGIVTDGGAGFSAINTISMNNGGAEFSASGGATFDSASGYNMSSDATAPGAQPLKSMVAAQQFISLTGGALNLFLKDGSDAVNSGRDLSSALTTDISGEARPAGGAWDLGADEAPASFGNGIVTNTYTIGTRTANVDITTVSGGPTLWTVQLAPGTDLSNVAVNDKLVDEASTQKNWKVTAVDDANDRVTVMDSEANGSSPSAAGAKQATLSRWYTTLAAWETAQQGDLVARDAIEEGALYKDSTFTAGVTINGWTTDPARYIRLYAPAGQRHNGTKGTGVVITPPNDSHAVDGYEDYVRVEGLEIDGSAGLSSGRISIVDTSAAAEWRISGNLFHDCTSHCIQLVDSTNGSGTHYIYNNIFLSYGSSWDAVRLEDSTTTTYLLSNTAYNTANRQAYNAIGGTVIAKNNISLIGSGAVAAFTGTYSGQSGYNLSSDTSAPGSGSLTNKTAANQFVSLTGGSENLHLKAGADAINTGFSMPDVFTTDIDGTTRTGTWDMGADESSTASGTITTNVYTIGTRTANVDITSVSGSGPWTVQLAGGTDLSNVAVNDKLSDEASTAKAWKITAVNDAADTVTVTDSEANGGSPSAAGSTQATISRWYTTMALWEDARDGDLIARNAIEKGEMYNDSVYTGFLTIDDSTTDAARYMWLTVAPGHRHKGLAGTGVRIDPTSGGQPVVIDDAYTKVEWLEITGYVASGGTWGLWVGWWSGDHSSVRGVEVNNVMIHDPVADEVQNMSLIRVTQGASATIRNGLFYNPDLAGSIQGTGMDIDGTGGTQATVLNTVVWGSSQYAYAVASGTTATFKNCIGHSASSRWNIAGTVTADSDYNASSWSGDTAMPGVHDFLGVTQAGLFISSTAGGENFHLKPGSILIDAGMDLSSSFTTDMDGESRPQGNSWDIGADESLYDRSVATGTLVTYTLGSRTANINITGVTTGNNQWTVQLAAADLSNVAINDKLLDEAASAKAWKISAVDDTNDTVTVWDSEGNGGSPSAAGSTQATISRWYTTMAAWESARQGDLVARGTIEKGEMYKDSNFTETWFTIDGSTTDAGHYMWLTAAASQRYNGTAGTGVKLTGAGSGVIGVSDPYTKVEWLEITAWSGGDTASGVMIDGSAGGTNVALNHLLIHDYPNATGGVAQHGIYGYSGATATITNTIIYNGDGDGAGILALGSGTMLKVYNCTIYRAGPSTGYGISADTSPSALVRNTIVFNSGWGDFTSTGFSAASSHNMSSNTSAPGDYAIKSKAAADQFISLTSGLENFHLKDGSDAINAGADLSSVFTPDVDNQTRPFGSAWDMGADEAPAGFTGGTVTNTYTIGTRTANVDITSVSGNWDGWTVQLAAADLSNVAINDKLSDEAASAKSWKITAVDDAADTVTVIDSQGNGGSPSAAGSTQATISRWYTSASTGLQDWETARQGDLVARDAIEKGELYKDSTFTGTLSIDGSTTDAGHYLWLTTGAGQRHNGTAGTGVVISYTTPTNSSPIGVRDPYTRIEGIELTGGVGTGNGAAIGIGLGTGSDNTTIDGVIIHDWTHNGVGGSGTAGIQAWPGGSNYTIKNSLLYNGLTSGANAITIYSSSTASIYNTTIYRMEGGAGVNIAESGTITAKNVISAGTAPSGHFVVGSGQWGAGSGYNLSSDATAPGSGSLINKTAANQFVSLTGGSENFHLKAGADALNAGTSLSDVMAGVDIDNQVRPDGAAWDIGADERDTTGPTIVARETADLDADGYLDAVKVTFNEEVLDSSVQASDFDVSGVGGEAFSSTTNGDIANNAVIYLTFTDGVHHTGVTPTLAYTQSGATDVTDKDGNLLGNSAAVAATDAAKPVLLTALANVASGGDLFNAAGERLDLIFSEPMSGAPVEGQLETALAFAGGAVDADNLPSTGTGSNPFSLIGITVSNDTIRVTHTSGNTANANLLTVGTHTVRVTAGASLTDAAGNAANTAAAAVTITDDNVPPLITARETADLDADGSIDAIKLTFSESVKDSTVQANDFDVSGVTGEAFSSTTNGDTANNAVIYITFTDGTHNSGATPTISYTQSGATDVTDLSNNKLANSAATAATDKAQPIALSYETADLDVDGFIDAIKITLSEPIQDSTVIANDFDVSGVTGEAFSSTTGGDTADDADFYLTFTDGVLDTAATPTITYTQDSPTDADVADAAGNKAANSAGAVTVHTPDWWDAAWKSRKKITFDNSGQAENLANFPVLIKLDSTRINYAKTKDAGEDIRFVDATTGPGGAALAYEIEKWDEAGTSWVWVKVPQIDASSKADHIWLYYNNTGASDAQSATGVWDSNFKGVWHLKEVVTDEATSGTHADSTSSGNTGTQNNNDDATGKIDKAQDFDGTNDRIGCGTSTSLSLQEQTFSAWVYKRSTGVDQPLLNRESIATDGWEWQIYSNETVAWAYYDGAIRGWYPSTGTIPLNTWTYVAGVWDKASGNVKFYINGNLDSTVGTTTGTITNSASRECRIGMRTYTGTALNGILDEVRISNTPRTAAWIKADYLSQSDTLNTYRTEEVYGTPAVAWWDTTYAYRKRVSVSAASGNALTAGHSAKLTEDTGALVTAGKLQADRDDWRIVYQPSDTLRSLSFDGTDDYVIKNPAGAFATTDITAEFWMKTSDTTKAGSPVSYASSASDNDFLIHDYTNFVIYRGGVNTGATGVSANDGAWHHVAVTWRNSDGQVKIYKDGTSAYTGTLASGTSITGGGSLVVGQEQDSVGGGFDVTQAFLGQMDELRISKTIRYSANFTPATTPYTTDANTLLLMHFDESSGTVALDESGLGNHGAHSGGVTHSTDGKVSTTRQLDRDYVGATETWFKAQAPVAASSADGDYYAYYGNASATSGPAEKMNVYAFNDDFPGSGVDTTKWTITNSTGWSVATGELKGTSTTGRLTSISKFSAGVTLEIKSRYISLPTNGYQIGGFFLSTSDGFGLLNHPGNDYYRDNGGWTQIAATAPSATNLLTTIKAKSSTAVDLTVKNYDTGTGYQSVSDVNNAVASEPLVLGWRYDECCTGQTYEAYWDWVKIRNYVATEPSLSQGSETAKPSTGTTTTDKAGPAILSAQTLDLDNDGKPDAAQITASEAVNDSTATGSGGYDVATFSGEAFAATGTANDAVFRVTFTEAASANSGVTPAVTVASASLKDLSAAANAAPNQTFAATTDGAKPVLLAATASGTSLFNAAGEAMDLVFSETLSAAPTEANLEAALTFAGGATDGDNLPSTGGGSNPLSLATTNLSNDTIRVAFTSGNTANANLLTPGTHTVQVTTGTNITDSASNPANTTPAAITIAADTTAPTITARETTDLDSDGYLDAIKLTFSENIQDSTVQASDFDVSGVTGEAFSGTTNGDTADNTIVYLTFTDGVHNSGATPTLAYTQSGATDVKDLSGNNLANSGATAATDKAKPVAWTVETADLDTDGSIDALKITLSEAVADTGIVANDFDVSGIAGEAFSSTTGGDTADDSDFYLTFTDGVLDTAQTPGLTYTQDSPTDNDVQDAAGNKLANLSSNTHSPAWWNTSWTRRRKLTFNNANQAENLPDFPVLIKLDSTRVDYAQVQNSGQDLRFIDADGTTVLPYEIEKYDEAGTSSVWVKVPQIDSGSVTDFIWVYYGNASAQDCQTDTNCPDAVNVWDANFKGVWHLPNGTTLSAADSVSVPHNGTITEATATAGKMDGGGTFDGTNDFIDFGDITSLNALSHLTLSLWVYGDWNRSFVHLVDKHNYGVSGFVLQTLGTTDAERRKLLLLTSKSPTAYWSSSNANVLVDNTWQHIAMTYDGTQGTAQNRVKFYVNGVDQTAASGNDAPDAYSTNSLIVALAKPTADPADSYFKGALDEVRASAATRSAAWVKADYLSQTDALLTYGGEEASTISAPAWWNTNWTRRRKVFFDNSQQAENLPNFPVLIALTSSEVDYAQVQNSGQDLRFIDADGSTVLPYELEKYDEAGTSYLWVKVPQIDQSSTADYVWMYYGNSSAQDCQTDTNCPDAVNVWDSNFNGVWHLKEDPTTTCSGTKEFCDSTSNANHGDANNMEAGDQTAGKIAGSVNLDGVNEYIDTNSTVGNWGTGDFTVSAWFRTSATGEQHFAGKRVSCDNSSSLWNVGLTQAPPTDTGAAIMEVSAAGTNYKNVQGKKNLHDNIFHHVATLRTGTTTKVYVDGIEEGSGTGYNQNISNAANLQIGNNPCGTMTGILDEVRVSNSARSAAWLAAEYRAGARAFVTISSEQLSIATTATDKAGPAILSAQTLDTNNNGKLDAVQVTASESVTDASASGSGGYDVAGRSGEAFAATGTANDAVFRVTFTEGASADSGAVPNVTVASASLTDRASPANAAPAQTFSATSDGAKPVLLSAGGTDVTTTGVFNDAGDQIDLVFSEAVSAAPTEANLEAALTFAGGATDGDNLPSTGSGSNPIALATTTTSNDTIRVTFGSGNTANANLLTLGTHTVQVTTGTNITDAANNQANTAPAAVTVSGIPAGRTPRSSGTLGSPSIY